MEQEAKAHQDEHQREFLSRMAAHFRRILTGEPFISHSKESVYCPATLENVFVSLCYTCEQPSLWLHDRLIYPPAVTGPPPNPDLSDDIRHDYEEARRILDLSPRGAAALLRLAVEKICRELGAHGASVDKQIGSLVAKGPPVAVQQALDAVRVIGNEAVQPGQIDIRDDRQTAARLFELVNFIAEDQISRPKRIDEVYRIIPEDRRKAIDARNAKAKGFS